MTRFSDWLDFSAVMPHNGYMNIETKCQSIIRPNPMTMRADGTYTAVVYTDAAMGDRGYITVEDMITLGRQAYIRIVDANSNGVAGQYGRTIITYFVN